MICNLKLSIYIILIINFTNINAKSNDSILYNTFELNTFRAFSKIDYYKKADQLGYYLKFSIKLKNKNKICYSINPCYTNLKTIYFRGAFFDSTKHSSDMDLITNSNSYGLTGGLEYFIDSKLSLKTEIGLTYSKVKKIREYDNFNDTSTFSYCSNPIYKSTNELNENKLNLFSSFTVIIRLKKQFGFNIGVHYRPSSVNILNTTSFEKCNTTQIQQFKFKTNSTHVSIGANFHF